MYGNGLVFENILRRCKGDLGSIPITVRASMHEIGASITCLNLSCSDLTDIGFSEIIASVPNLERVRLPVNKDLTDKVGECFTKLLRLQHISFLDAVA